MLSRSMLKRFAVIICLCIVSCTLLTGCSNKGVKEAKTEAAELEKTYTKEFEQEVIKCFGNDAILKDVKGRINSRQYGVWFDTMTYSLPILDGVLVYDGHDYKVSYDTVTKELMSTFNFEKAKESLFAALPLDMSKIVYSYVYSSSHEEPQFVMTSDDGTYGLASYRDNLFWYILTTEDISDLHKEDFVDYLALQQKCTGSNDIYIFSCKDGEFNNIDHFKRNITDIKASDYGHHPEVYYDKDMIDIFSLYNLENTCEVGTESFETDEGSYEDLIFYLLSRADKDEPLRKYRFFLNPDNHRLGAIDSDEYRWTEQ